MENTIDKKINMARCIATVAKHILDTDGENLKLKIGYIRVAQIGDLGFHFYTPFSGLPGNTRYALGIWFDFVQVFDARWEPFIVKKFTFGPWINLLLHEGYSIESDIAFLLAENEWLIPEVPGIVSEILGE